VALQPALQLRLRLLLLLRLPLLALLHLEDVLQVDFLPLLLQLLLGNGVALGGSQRLLQNGVALDFDEGPLVISLGDVRGLGGWQDLLSLYPQRFIPILLAVLFPPADQLSNGVSGCVDPAKALPLIVAYECGESEEDKGGGDQQRGVIAGGRRRVEQLGVGCVDEETGGDESCSVAEQHN
jgi:hypothetical protein